MLRQQPGQIQQEPADESKPAAAAWLLRLGAAHRTAELLSQTAAKI
jgi:hypothetical protein